jgi:DUF971 family protein
MSDAHGTRVKPTEIRLKRDDKVLEIDFEDGRSFRLPAELLRVESPSAEVRGHGAGDKRTVAGRRHVGIMEIETVGNYAIRIDFDDLHGTGIYTWTFLYDLGRNQDAIWRAYLDELESQGLSRDP